MNRSKKIKRLVLLSMFIGIEIVLMSTPLGYIPIGAIKATTLHIPVIIISILLGPKEGAILGFMFGFSSILINTFNPSLFSFCFSPFYSLGEISGNLSSVLIAIIPRMMIGILAGLIYKLLSKKLNIITASSIAGFVSTLSHTALVMSMIYFFFGKEYALAANFAYETFINVILTTILTNGVIEALLAIFVTISIIKAFKVKGAIK